MSHPRRPLAPLTTLLSLALVGGLAVGVPGPAGAADPAPIDGPQTSGDVLFPHVGNGGYDAQHYDVDLAWTPAAALSQSTIAATTTMEATTTGAPLRTLSLDLEGLDVASVTVDGVPATYTRIDDAEEIRHKLVVTPAVPVSGDFTVEVVYGGVPQAHRDADGSLEGWNATADGATFLNQPIGAMTAIPHNNTPSDKATWTFRLDVPSTLVGGGTTGSGPAAAVSNGDLVSRTPSDDGTRTTWVWDQPNQMASELALISIGRYAVYQDRLRLASGRVLPEWTFIDPAISAGNRTRTLATRAQQKAIIDRLETVYGPYPGVSTGLVVDVVPNGISYALETQDRSFFPSSAGLSTTVHEITHQWWGDAVAPRVWNDIWINEGMATWSESNYANVLSEQPDDPATTTEDDFFTQWADVPADSADGEWTIPPAGMTDSADLYGFQTYSRSAMMWEALKAAIGDADFYAFVRAWQDRYTGDSHGTADFVALAEEVSGEDLDAFFDDWIRDADKPAWPATYDVALAASPRGALATGDAVTYTLSAESTGKVPTVGAVVAVDLADVLDDASLDPAALPAGLTLKGTTLTWRVPRTALTATSQARFTVRVAPDASAGRLAATADPTTLGATCTSCATSQKISLRQQTLTPRARIKGRPVVGTRLRALSGPLDPGTTRSYRWRVGGEVVARGPKLAVRAAYVGRHVKVTVISSKPGFRTVEATSPRTKVVRRR